MKELKDMSLEELWELFPIVLKEHNSDYAVWYEDEKRNLVGILNDYKVCRVNHIGSTSVNGLIAKPIIDILLELPNDYDIDIIASILQSEGWIVMARNTLENTLDLNKGYTPNGFAAKVFHLHIKPSGDWGELYFRDYLKKYPNVARQYEKLKLQLKKQFKYNRDAYTDAKSDFIMNFTQKAREELAELYLPSNL
ncbi:GrpB family protein [Lacrimispora brassicae]